MEVEDIGTGEPLFFNFGFEDWAGLGLGSIVSLFGVVVLSRFFITLPHYITFR